MGGLVGKDGEDASNPSADAQARIAEQLYSQTDPIRQALIGRSAAFLGTPTSSAGGGGSEGVSFKGAEIIPGSTGTQVQAANGMSGMDMVTNSPTFIDYKRMTNDQFKRARENAIARNASGGALTESLVNLEGQQAGALSQGAGAIYSDELNRAMTLGTGGASQSLSGFGQAGAIQAQMAAAQSQQNAGKAGALGTGLGAYLGTKA